MEFTDFKADIITYLGGNLIDVELTDVDIIAAFRSAVATYEQKGNVNQDHAWVTFPVVAKQRVYTVPNNIITIQRILKPSSGLYATNPFHMAIIQDIFGNLGSTPGSTLLSYELELRLLENIEKYTVYDQQFYYRPFRHQVELQFQPQTAETWFMEVYQKLEDEQYRELLWIQNWTLAECKIILGRAYSKFSSLSAPTGETSLDGQSLVQEGKDDMASLLQEIADYTDGEPIGGLMIMG